MSKREMAGTIKFFDQKKGYGFAAADDKGKDIYIHATAFKHLTGTGAPHAGDRIIGRVELHGKRRKFVEVCSITPPLAPRVNGKSHDPFQAPQTERLQKPGGARPVKQAIPTLWGDGHVQRVGRKGFAFVALDETESEVYVRKDLTNGLQAPLDVNDLVRVRYREKRENEKSHVAKEIRFR